jgi:hydrogenase/urease accessory protein HupE
MNIKELKYKKQCDYTLKETIFIALLTACIILCFIFNIGILIWAAAIKSILATLFAIPITFLGAVLLGVILYIDPDIG